MIKLNVLAKDKGDHIEGHIDGDINSRGDLLVYEMCYVLEEFEQINNSEMLEKAFQLMLKRLQEEL